MHKSDKPLDKLKKLNDDNWLFRVLILKTFMNQAKEGCFHLIFINHRNFGRKKSYIRKKEKMPRQHITHLTHETKEASEAYSKDLRFLLTTVILAEKNPISEKKKKYRGNT